MNDKRLSEEVIKNESYNELLIDNENLVKCFFTIAVSILFITAIIHIYFTACFLVNHPAENTPALLQFIAFNTTVLIIDCFRPYSSITWF